MKQNTRNTLISTSTCTKCTCTCRLVCVFHDDVHVQVSIALVV